MSINHNCSVKEPELKQNKKHAKSFLGFLMLPVMLALLFVLAGCSGDGNSIAGKWVDSGGNSIEFFSDGTFTTNRSDYYGTFVIDGDRIKLSSSLSSQPVIYTVSLSDQILTFVADNGSVFKFVRPENAVTSTINAINSANDSQAKSDAATIDNACKDLYAEVVAGTLNQQSPGRLVSVAGLPSATDSTTARKQKARQLTVGNALTYAGIEHLSSRLDDLAVNEYGSIHAKIDTRYSTSNSIRITPSTTFAELGYK